MSSEPVTYSNRAYELVKGDVVIAGLAGGDVFTRSEPGRRSTELIFDGSTLDLEKRAFPPSF